jgi:ABC-type lipoprotein export system ATPase subunit
MVTHDAEAARVADKQFQLDRGKLIQTGENTCRRSDFSETKPMTA